VSDERRQGRLSTDGILTVPNVLSALRLASVPVFLFLFISGREEAAVILYGVGAFTDFLDGFIARRLGQISELGKVLDPMADRVFIVALAVALVVAGTLQWWLAALIVVRDLLMVGLFPLLQRSGLGRIPVNFAGKTATAFLLIGLTWLALARTDFWWAPDDTVGLAIVLAGTVLYYVAVGLYAREAFRRLEHLRAQDRERHDRPNPLR